MWCRWSALAALSTIFIVATTATTTAVAIQSTSPAPADETEAAQRLSRALFMAQMVHFIKWPLVLANSSGELTEPSRITFCMLHQRPAENQPAALTEASVLQQRNNDAAGNDTPRIVTFHHYSQLQLHLVNDHCHVIYGDYAQLKELPYEAILQLNMSSFTVSDNLAF